MRYVLSVALIHLSIVVSAAAQTPVTPPPLPAEQVQRLNALPPATQVYEKFRYWAGFQPPAVQ